MSIPFSNVLKNIGERTLENLDVGHVIMHGMLDRPKYWKLERIVKGAANHRRIEIMEMLDAKPGLSLIETANGLHINFKTAGEHTRRLAIAGLVEKHSDGTSMRHSLTPRGRTILMFLRTLE